MKLQAATAPSSGPPPNISTRSLCTSAEMGSIASLAQSIPLSQPDIERLKSGRFRKLIGFAAKSTDKKTKHSALYNINRTRAAKRLERVIRSS